MLLEEEKIEKVKKTKSETRRRQIIDSALKVLAFEGASSFTLRNVAEKAGVTLGAVQYYFKNKSDLLLALMEYKLQQDFIAMEDARLKSNHSPEAQFGSLINLLLRDNKKPFVFGLDFQLFALACSDKTAEKCVDTFYRTVLQWVDDLIQPMNPTITEVESRHRAMAVLAMLEGMMQVVYRDKRNKADYSQVEDIVRREALRIAKDPA